MFDQRTAHPSRADQNRGACPSGAHRAASADQSNLPFLASLFLLGRFRDETQREYLNQHFSQQAILSTSTMPNLWTCLTQNGHPDGWPFHKEVRRCPTLPQGPPCSTIGAESLSFRVRNVTGRFPLAMAAETLLIYVSIVARTLVLDAVPDRKSGTTKWTRANTH